MRKLLTVIGLLASVFCVAQTQYLGTPTTLIYIRGSERVDSVIFMPQRDTNFTPTQNALISKASDGYLYFWNGQWNRVTMGFASLSLQTSRLLVGGTGNIPTATSAAFQWDSTHSILLLTGLKTGAQQALQKFNDTVGATPSAAASRDWVYFAPLDTAKSPPTFNMNTSSTAYTGVGRRDNVWNLGWNLDAGAGKMVGNWPGIGISMENQYIPTVGDTNVEWHIVHLRQNSAVQDRLLSFTIKEYLNNYDSYFTVGRTYWRAPSLSGNNNYVFAMLQPGSFTLDGDPLDTVTTTNNFNIQHDTIVGVQFTLSGNKPGSRNFVSSGFSAWSLPGILTSSGNTRFTGGGVIYPETDNTATCGDPSFRWSTIYGVNGVYTSVRTQFLTMGINKVTSNYSVTTTDHTVLIDASGGNITITLPTAGSVFFTTSSAQYVLQRIDNSANTVTIQAQTGDTINGSATQTLTTQYQAKTLQPGTNVTWAMY